MNITPIQVLTITTLTRAELKRLNMWKFTANHLFSQCSKRLGIKSSPPHVNVHKPRAGGGGIFTFRLLRFLPEYLMEQHGAALSFLIPAQTPFPAYFPLTFTGKGPILKCVSFRKYGWDHSTQRCRVDEFSATATPLSSRRRLCPENWAQIGRTVFSLDAKKCAQTDRKDRDAQGPLI